MFKSEDLRAMTPDQLDDELLKLKKDFYKERQLPLRLQRRLQRQPQSPLLWSDRW